MWWILIRIVVIDPQTAPEEPTFTPSVLIAIVAIFVSIAAIILPIRYSDKMLSETKQQNKLSVKPHMTPRHRLTEDNKTEWLEIKNGGLGPAIVTSLIYIYKGREYRRITELYIAEQSKDFMNKNIESAIGNIFYGENTPIPAGESLMLYKNEFKKAKNLIALLVFIKDITLRIEYESMYGENFTMDEKIRD